MDMQQNYSIIHQHENSMVPKWVGVGQRGINSPTGDLSQSVSVEI